MAQYVICTRVYDDGSSLDHGDICSYRASWDCYDSNGSVITKTNYMSATPSTSNYFQSLKTNVYGLWSAFIAYTRLMPMRYSSSSQFSYTTQDFYWDYQGGKLPLLTDFSRTYGGGDLYYVPFPGDVYGTPYGTYFACGLDQDTTPFATIASEIAFSCA
jgi:hypothetical protein